MLRVIVSLFRKSVSIANFNRSAILAGECSGKCPTADISKNWKI